MKKQKPAPIVIAQDEATLIGPGDTAYYVLLNEADAELLAEGRLPPELQARCQSLLSWKSVAETES